MTNVQWVIGRVVSRFCRMRQPSSSKRSTEGPTRAQATCGAKQHAFTRPQASCMQPPRRGMASKCSGSSVVSSSNFSRSANRATANGTHRAMCGTPCARNDAASEATPNGGRRAPYCRGRGRQRRRRRGRKFCAKILFRSRTQGSCELH